MAKKTSHSTKKGLRTSKGLPKSVLNWFDKYLRYVNYIGAAQLYLKENCLLKDELKPEHIKERILGHWGTVPGLSFIYAHLNYLITKHKPSMMYIAGPGHGAPAVIANLFVENTLAEYYPQLKRNTEGTENLIHMFSWPGGFPSHTNPGTPGAILEGGELGYSLATAFGAVMDNPDLLITCVVGDGEAETGPLATAWHGNKFLNPAESGAVLPILHANGYKITGPTIFATMSDDELTHLFTGYGYEPMIVSCEHTTSPKAHADMDTALETAYKKIRAIQKKARNSKKPYLKPRWPMIVLRSPKGDTGIKRADGHKVAGLYYSHGIPINDPRSNPEHFQLIKHWLESYHFNELIDSKGQPLKEVLTYVPKGNLRMGKNKHANGGEMLKALKLPPIKNYAVTVKKRGPATMSSNTAVSAKMLRDVIQLNPKNFRFMCPDETESNKFMDLFEVTDRAYMWPVHPYDESVGPKGRVMEVLSEHNLQGWLQGYLLTGRHGIFVTYEAFATIVASMVDQYAKFLKQSSKVKWRKPVASLNYLLTSVGWRQEHNGYSHQNPSFVSNILEKHGKFCSVYFPADANSMLVIMEDCLKRTNGINVIVAGKNPLPQWLTLEEAREEIKTGIGVWNWVDPTGIKNPDIVMAATGDALVQESMAAIQLLKEKVPELKMRFINVSELTALGIGDERHPLSIDNNKFEEIFTTDKPIIYNFHGYTGVIKKLIFGHKHAERFSIHGYNEEGTTTTPFEMMVLNKSSRFHLAIEALQKAAKTNPAVAQKAPAVIKYFEKLIADHEIYIHKYGKDNPEVDNWQWK